MKKTWILALLFMAGCVSMDKYKALQGQYQDQSEQNAALQQQLGNETASAQSLSQSANSLEAEKEDLERQTTDLGQEKTQMESDLSTLKAQMADLSAKKDALEADKAALLAASQEKEKQFDGLVSQLQGELADGQLKITQYQNMLTVDMADKILFDSGKAEIKADGRKILQKIGAALATSDKSIRVVGYTDNVPLLGGGAYASNWELSTARATTVVRFLQEHSKIDPSRLIAEGRGQYAPMAPNDTPENRQKNRRIEITLLDKSLVEAVKVRQSDDNALSATASSLSASAAVSLSSSAAATSATAASLSNTPEAK
jgi:chemotaxis protein MotB